MLHLNVNTSQENVISYQLWRRASRARIVSSRGHWNPVVKKSVMEGSQIIARVCSLTLERFFLSLTGIGPQIAILACKVNEIKRIVLSLEDVVQV